ncbi:MAG: DUF3108 domain-containing protein, partial [Saprospiraceae bacterium]|nr:DUF3108 domain-containing protein [Saprospiraceae bacterium]
MTLKSVFSKFCLAAFILCSMAFMPYHTALQKPDIAQNVASVSSISLNNSTFQAGEELTYKIYYNLNFVWIPAGEVIFKIEEEGEQYHLSAVGRTYQSYNWFFKVRDNYDTYVDKNTLLPSMSERNISEGKIKFYEKTTFDQNRKKAFYQRGDTKEKITRNNTIDLNEKMYDILSMVYYSRLLSYDDAKTGQEFPASVFLEASIYPLKYKFLGKEDKKIRDLGKWSTLKLSP